MFGRGFAPLEAGGEAASVIYLCQLLHVQACTIYIPQEKLKYSRLSISYIQYPSIYTYLMLSV